MSSVFGFSIFEAVLIFGAYCHVNNYHYKFKYNDKYDLYILKPVGKYVLCSTKEDDSGNNIYISINDLIGKEVIKTNEKLEKNTAKSINKSNGAVVEGSIMKCKAKKK